MNGFSRVRFGPWRYIGSRGTAGSEAVCVWKRDARCRLPPWANAPRGPLMAEGVFSTFAPAGSAASIVVSGRWMDGVSEILSCVLWS